LKLGVKIIFTVITEINEPIDGIRIITKNSLTAWVKKSKSLAV
jgi:hypothetical protein